MEIEGMCNVLYDQEEEQIIAQCKKKKGGVEG